MMIVVQRVTKASIIIENKIYNSINKGALLLLGVHKKDTKQDVEYLAKKINNLRFFNDKYQKMNQNINQIKGDILVVSQFTLCANTSRGRRPSFIKAANPEEAEGMYQQFCEQLKVNNIPIERGRFGAMMDASLVNDGPVTILLDSREKN